MQGEYKRRYPGLALGLSVPPQDFSVLGAEVSVLDADFSVLDADFSVQDADFSVQDADFPVQDAASPSQGSPVPTLYGRQCSRVRLGASTEYALWLLGLTAHLGLH